MTNEYYVPDWMLKRAAKQLSRQLDITHHQALNELAIEQGFQGWSELKRLGIYCMSEEDPVDWVFNTSSKIVSSFDTDQEPRDYLN